MSGGAPEDDPLETLMQLLRALHGESEQLVKSISATHAIHRTDMEALGVVMDAAARGGPVGPAQLARDMGLSAPATTAMLDRLERAAHLRRVPHPTDRRRVVLEVQPEALRVVGASFGPFAREFRAAMAGFDAAELDVVRRFLDVAVATTARARRAEDD